MSSAIRHPPSTFALLPAAGHSTRMGRPKLSLPLGTCTVIEQVVGNLRSAGIEKVMVVVGPHVPELEALAERAGATVLLLSEETPDMRGTVERGLSWIEENWRPVEEDAFLLVPADHPALDVDVIRALLKSRRAGRREPPDKSPCQNANMESGGLRRPARRGVENLIDSFIPTYLGRRGHPALIGWRHVAGIRALPANLGLNAYLRHHSDEALEIAVQSETILLDLDTPEDYSRLLKSFVEID